MVDLQTRDVQTINENVETYMQTEVNCQDLGTQSEVLHLESKNMQTENNGNEVSIQSELRQVESRDMQTEYNGEERGIQSEVYQLESKDIQTEEQEVENKEYSEVDIQCDPIPTPHSSKDTQTPLEKRVQTREVTQQVHFRAPLTTSYTQTTPEPAKKTRTGGVQVSIGNRMHYKQIKLARILTKFSSKEASYSEETKLIQSKFFNEWKTSLELENAAQIYQAENALNSIANVCTKYQKNNLQSFVEKLKDNTIKCMLFDQEKVVQNQEKFMELEEAFRELSKQNEMLQNRQLYLEDLIEKKDKDFKLKKEECKNANKKVNELNKVIDQMKGKRRSTGSLTGKHENNSSFISDRKQR